MTAGGMSHVEGPTVCPFVALESDRDRRLDEPDPSHRCYAEPTPAPRAIAHQEAYCLSPGFTLCPIFQDWARRAAATPVITSPQQLSNAAGAAAAGAAAVGEPEQLGVFDAPVEPAPWLAATPEHVAPPDSQPVPPPAPPSPPAPIERIPSSAEGPRTDEPAPLPAFLASRERPMGSPERGGGPPPPDAAAVQRVRTRVANERAAQREALVPSREREERFNPPIGGRARIGRGEGSDFASRAAAILAVLALLSLALLLLVFAPGFFGGASGSPSPARSGAGTAVPGRSQAPSTAGSSLRPGATPQTYTIQAGDSMFNIARRFGITVEQLQAANPQITNPNLIQAGQVIVIPPFDFGLPTAGPAAPRATP